MQKNSVLELLPTQSNLERVVYLLENGPFKVKVFNGKAKEIIADDIRDITEDNLKSLTAIISRPFEDCAKEDIEVHFGISVRGV